MVAAMVELLHWLFPSALFLWRVFLDDGGSGRRVWIGQVEALALVFLHFNCRVNIPFTAYQGN